MITEKSKSALASSFSTQSEKLLLEIIRQRTGIVIQKHQLEKFRAAVQSAINDFNYANTEQLTQVIRNAPLSHSTLEYIISEITVPESYFFREIDQINFLREHYLPALIKQRENTTKTIRIWSAGCANGQELYTLLFLLVEIIQTPSDWNLQLLGTDINQRNLANSQSGEYSEWSFRNTSKIIKQYFFHQQGNRYRLKDKYRSMVNFKLLNLVEDPYPNTIHKTENMDLILCRNVFIYFDKIAVQSTLNKIINSLATNGVLLVGSSDLVDQNIPGLTLKRYKDAFYFEKVNQPSSKPMQHTKDLASKTASTDGSNTNNKPKIQIASNRLPPNCGNDENFQQLDYLQEATLLANTGKTDLALQNCKSALEVCQTNKQAHYLLAMLHIEKNELNEAETALRKALFIDPQFFEAHYQLALVQIRLNQFLKAEKSLANALSVIEHADPKQWTQHSNETSIVQVKAQLRKEIEYIKATVQVN